MENNKKSRAQQYLDEGYQMMQRFCKTCGNEVTETDAVASTVYHDRRLFNVIPYCRFCRREYNARFHNRLRSTVGDPYTSEALRENFSEEKKQSLRLLRKEFGIKDWERD